ncbi:hypothetical protein HDU99_006417, partial [Rhizoclosmatium hyalinum]
MAKIKPGLVGKQTTPYAHESRHKHAMRRPRGPGGRFLSAAELAALKEVEASGSGGGVMEAIAMVAAAAAAAAIGSSWLTALPSLAPTLFPASSASASTSLVVVRGTTTGDSDCVSVTASTSESVVRLLNLARVKKSAENSKAAIQELSPGVPFEVKSLALSSNGKLLALAGEFHVAVMVLPPSLKYSAALKTSETLQTVREVKLHTIGDVYHSQNSSPIAKVAWHPLSESHCHLVVLTADGILRMYDMSSDPSEPEQVAYFSDQSEYAPYKSPSSTNPSPVKRTNSK